MKTKIFNFNRDYLITIVLLIVAMVFVACEGGDEGDEPGVATSDPFPTQVGGVEDFPETQTPTVGEGALTPLSPVMEDPTPTVDLMVTQEATPIMEATMPAEQPTATLDVIITSTPETGTGVITQTQDMSVIQAVLASDLVGMDITNQDGEEVGEVSELLVRTDGTIEYALFDVGGFLGIGAKTVAVTWDNFEIRHRDNVMMSDTMGTTDNTAVGTATPAVGTTTSDVVNIDEYTIVYTGMAPDLENLPEFETNLLDSGGYILGDVITNTVGSDFDTTPYIGLLQVGEFADYNLLNTQDEDLGEVEDLIVDVSEGQVVYAVVDFGGFLGIGENSVAVPWEQLRLEADTETFRLDVEPAALESAPAFDFGTWEYPLEEGWDLDYRTYWEVSSR